MTKKTESFKVRAVGINHVAFEVGDLDEALAELRAKGMAPGNEAGDKKR